MRSVTEVGGEAQPSSRGPLGESWQAWTALLIGVLAISAHAASSIVYSILMKPMLAEFGAQRTEFATAMSVRMLVMVLAISFAGQFTDRFGARVVLASGAAIVGAGNLAASAMQSMGQFYPIMAFMGPGQAAVGSVAASALVLRLFRRRKGLAIGVLNGGDNLINSGLSVAAAAALGHWGWRGTVGAMGLVYVLLALFIYWALSIREPASTGRVSEKAGRVSLRDLPWRDRRLWVVFVSYAGIYAFITSVQLHFHAFQTDLGRSPAAASQVLGMQILVGALGAPLFGWVAERTGARSALMIVVAGLTATSVALWTVQSYAAFTAWALSYGLVNSGVVALLTLVLHELFGTEQIGRLMGVAMVFCMSATMLANVYSAAMFDAWGSYVPVWQSYTALMLLVLVPVTWLWRR
jgi:MFS family permease